MQINNPTMSLLLLPLFLMPTMLLINTQGYTNVL